MVWNMVVILSLLLQCVVLKDILASLYLLILTQAISFSNLQMHLSHSSALLY
jgi:hypothetical protein